MPHTTLLNKDWITEKHIDFEYKKYVLLAYLQNVDECFRTSKLYPTLADLIEHYKTAKSIKENKTQLSSQFPKRLNGIEQPHFRLHYEQVIEDDKVMNEIEAILDFSIPKFAGWLYEGKQIYDFLEQKIKINPIGILPLDTTSGYLLLKDASAKTQVYCFSVSLFEHSTDIWRGIHTQYIRTYTKGIMHSFDAIKSELITENRNLPNPAVFAAETNMEIPVNETFLPIAKRMLIREVSTQAS